MLSESQEYHLRMTANDIIRNNKGILALDENPAKLGKKLEENQVENTLRNRNLFREILMKTEAIESAIKGIILHEESFTHSFMEDNQRTLATDYLIKRGFFLIVKLDEGVEKTETGEFVTKGENSLEKKFLSKKFASAKASKWRVVFQITKYTPTFNNLEENCRSLTQFAKLSQKNNMVPIIEPEILFEGNHSVEECEAVSKIVYSHIFYHLNMENVHIQGCILKISFVTPGESVYKKIDPLTIAMKTIRAVESSVPSGIPGILFLSGGHTPAESKEYLYQVNMKAGKFMKTKFSFSFGRALTNNALKAFDPNKLDPELIQQKLYSDVCDVRKSMFGDDK